LGEGVYGTISDANRGINASGLQYMALKMCIGSIVPELETSSKCFVSILPGGNYLNTRYAAILSKRIFWILFLELFPAVHYIFIPNLGIKDVVWAKKISA
jgi:hypothetical protein